MKLIKRRTIYFENGNINMIVIDFGASFYVWVGKFSNIELLSVSFPLSVSCKRQFFVAKRKISRIKVYPMNSHPHHY